MKSVCVFLGAKPGTREEYRQATIAMGREIANRGLRLVYGGSAVGLMREVADAALAAGGEVEGVIPRALYDKEIGHTGITRLHVVESMHERKAMMAELSDGFVALPGGMGTMEELFEVFTWAQLGFHQKPCALLNVDGYYDLLHQFFDLMASQGFVKQEHREMLLTHADPAELLRMMDEYVPTAQPRWVTERKEL